MIEAAGRRHAHRRHRPTHWSRHFTCVYTAASVPRTNRPVANVIMRTHGTLTKWNDDRGFGFIKPAGAGDEIFVHVSAFPRDSVRPRIDELISFDIETGGDGRKRAVRVLRPGSRTDRPAAKGPAPSRATLAAILGLLIGGALGGYAYRTFTLTQYDASRQVAPSPAADTAALDQFACDGRTRCTQMTSCAEAMYFLQHCPGVQMDGDHDGTPCEQQWCN